MNDKYTNKNKSKKLRSQKSKSQKLRNRKVLKKLINSNNDILDENIKILIGGINENENINGNENENIKILIGGENKNNSNLIYPTNFDSKLLGYEPGIPIDKRTVFEKYSQRIANSFEIFGNIIAGLVANKVIKTAGYENKTSEEIGEKLKNDTEKLEKINDYFDDPYHGEKAKKEIGKTVDIASGIIGESFEKLPDEVEDSLSKVADKGMGAVVESVKGVPFVGAPLAVASTVEKITNAAGDVADATGKIAELTETTAEKLKEPVNKIERQLDEISSKATRMSNIQEEMEEEKEMEKEMEEEEEMEKEMKKEKNGDNQMGDDNQMGGNLNKMRDFDIDKNSNMSKFVNQLQHGGKKLRNRVNITRHSFKNVSKNVTQKKR